MSKRPTYSVISFQSVPTKRAAEALAARQEYRTQVVVVHPYGSPCPAGHDHAHAMYDGATYCRGCERFLTLQLEKRL